MASRRDARNGRAPASQAAPPFNIRLWFALVSLVVIASLGGALGFLMSEFVARRLLYREAELTQEFLQSIVLAEHTARDVFRPETPDGLESMESFTDHMVGLPGVFRANMYAIDRRIVWSTDRGMTGRTFEGNRELEAAFAGGLLVEIGHIADAPAKAEHVDLHVAGARHFIEVYMPMREHGGEVVGVVEFYKAPDALEATIRSAQWIIWVGVAVAAIVLYTTLFWVVRRGAKVIESQHRQLTSMETMAALGQMAGAMAHSLRNPLAGLRSSAELVAAGDLETAPDAARSIVAEADRMDRHIRDLLIYTRAEKLDIQPIDPVDAVRGCVVDARLEIDRRRISVEIQPDGGTGRRIGADPILLRQAIASLISNALEAMAHGGRLLIVVRGADSDTRVQIEITDSGLGMGPETLLHVATPFFTTKPMGLGLGLVLARRIVERFGGSLTIVSAIDRGTSVTMDFPALN